MKHGALELPEVTLEPDHDAELFAYVFKTKADPFAGRINFFRVYQGVMKPDTQVLNTRAHAKERIGTLLVAAGQGHRARRRVRPGRHRRRREAQGDARGRLARRPRRADRDAARSSCPQPVMAFAIEAKAKGDEDKVFTSLRRLQEEDPTIDLHRDTQTGDQIVAGLSQIHVEVIVDRLKERFGAEVTLKPPRVPYQETIRKPGQGARPPQEADRRPRAVRRLPHRDRAASRAARTSSSSTRSRAA